MSRITQTQWIWRDGEFIPWADATEHVLSHSMQFGSAAFEGLRCYATSAGPAIFRLREPDEHASLRGYSASSGNAMSGLSWRIDGARKSPPW